MLKIKSLIILLVLFGICFFQAENAHAISWGSNLESALKKAKGRQKPVMADFYTSWCGWCTKLDRTTFSDRKVNKLAREFICVKVNGDRDKDLVKKYNVRGYPTIIFFNSKGNIITRLSGYRGPADFARIMNNILKKTKPAVTKEPVSEEKKDLPPERPAPRVVRKKKRSGPFELTGIIYHPQYPQAIINDTIVKTEDKIGEAIVLKINHDEVILFYQSKRLVLKLPK